MKHVVSLSGGTASAVTAERVMNIFGKEKCNAATATLDPITQSRAISGAAK